MRGRFFVYSHIHTNTHLSIPPFRFSFKPSLPLFLRLLSSSFLHTFLHLFLLFFSFVLITYRHSHYIFFYSPLFLILSSFLSIPPFKMVTFFHLTFSFFIFSLQSAPPFFPSFSSIFPYSSLRLPFPFPFQGVPARLGRDKHAITRCFA